MQEHQLAANSFHEFQIRSHQPQSQGGMLGSPVEMMGATAGALSMMREPHGSHSHGLMESQMIPVSSQPQASATTLNNQQQQQQQPEPHHHHHQQQQQQQRPSPSSSEQWHTSPHLQGVEQEVAARRQAGHLVTYEEACLQYLMKTMPSDEEALSRKPARSGPRGKYTRYTGVSQQKTANRWEAHIWETAHKDADTRGRQIHLGSFDDPESAAKTYDRAAIYLRRRNAPLNFLPSIYISPSEPLLRLIHLPRADFFSRLRAISQHPVMKKTRGVGNAYSSKAASDRQLLPSMTSSRHPTDAGQQRNAQSRGRAGRAAGVGASNNGGNDDASGDFQDGNNSAPLITTAMATSVLSHALLLGGSPLPDAAAASSQQQQQQQQQQEAPRRAPSWVPSSATVAAAAAPRRCIKRPLLLTAASGANDAPPSYSPPSKAHQPYHGSSLLAQLHRQFKATAESRQHNAAIQQLRHQTASASHQAAAASAARTTSSSSAKDGVVSANKPIQAVLLPSRVVAWEVLPSRVVVAKPVDPSNYRQVLQKHKVILKGVPEPEDPSAPSPSQQVLSGSSAPTMLPPLLRSHSSAAAVQPPPQAAPLQQQQQQAPPPLISTAQLPFSGRYSMPAGTGTISDDSLLYPQLYEMSQEFNLLGVPGTGRSPAGSVSVPIAYIDGTGNTTSSHHVSMVPSEAPPSASVAIPAPPPPAICAPLGFSSLFQPPLGSSSLAFPSISIVGGGGGAALMGQASSAAMAPQQQQQQGSSSGGRVTGPRRPPTSHERLMQRSLASFLAASKQGAGHRPQQEYQVPLQRPPPELTVAAAPPPELTPPPQELPLGQQDKTPALGDGAADAATKDLSLVVAEEEEAAAAAAAAAADVPSDAPAEGKTTTAHTRADGVTTKKRTAGTRRPRGGSRASRRRKSRLLRSTANDDSDDSATALRHPTDGDEASGAILLPHPLNKRLTRSDTAAAAAAAASVASGASAGDSAAKGKDKPMPEHSRRVAGTKPSEQAAANKESDGAAIIDNGDSLQHQPTEAGPSAAAAAAAAARLQGLQGHDALGRAAADESSGGAGDQDLRDLMASLPTAEEAAACSSASRIAKTVAAAAVAAQQQSHALMLPPPPRGPSTALASTQQPGQQQSTASAMEPPPPTAAAEGGGASSAAVAAESSRQNLESLLMASLMEDGWGQLLGQQRQPIAALPDAAPSSTSSSTAAATERNAK